MNRSDGGQRGGRGGDRKGRPGGGRKPPPPDQTQREREFIRDKKESEDRLEFTLSDGTVIRGTITYYDRHMIKVAPESGPTLFVRKDDLRLIAEID